MNQKISVLFKPSSKSQISGDLSSCWYFEINNYKDLKIEYFKKHRKIKIAKVPYSEVWKLYEFCQNHWIENNVIVIMCNISELFE